MKQVSGNKSSSVAAIATMTAIALIGCSAIAVSSGCLDSYLPMRKQRNKEKLAAIDGQIEAIIMENASMRQNIELLSMSLDKVTVQNEKLLAENNALAQALKEEHDRVILLMNLITEDSEEKLALTQKLDEANSRLALLGYTARTDIAEETPSKEFIA